jgi:hypothetical protein
LHSGSAGCHDDFIERLVQSCEREKELILSKAESEKAAAQEKEAILKEKYLREVELLESNATTERAWVSKLLEANASSNSAAMSIMNQRLQDKTDSSKHIEEILLQQLERQQREKPEEAVNTRQREDEAQRRAFASTLANKDSNYEVLKLFQNEIGSLILPIK